jgi:hypothetical protein
MNSIQPTQMPQMPQIQQMSQIQQIQQMPHKVSNELVKLDVEHQHHMQDIQLEIQRESNAWKSCCFSLHPASTKFFGKFIVSLSIIGVCTYQLIVNINNCAAQIGYSSLLSLIVGAWLNIVV